tara:strand:+ start:1550 stop:2578 length:1029 start_codon:yes stop_codon:yes gene_type:complete
MSKIHIVSEFDDLITAAYEEAFDPYVEAIALTIEGKPSGKAWHEFQLVLAKAILLTHLLGIANVVEDAEIEGAQFEFDTDKSTFAKDEPWVVWHGEIEARPFEEAIKLFESRVPMVRSNVSKLAQMAQEQAASMVGREMGIESILDAQSSAISEALSRKFWVTTDEEDHKTVVDIQKHLGAALRGVSVETPVSLPDFIHKFVDEAQGLTAARLETVFRTNLSSAFNEANAAAYRTKEVKDIAPLIMLTEVDDDVVRPHHLAMNKYVNTVEYFDQRQLHPPNGFNCRGGTRILSWSEIERMGFLKDDEELDWKAIERHNRPMQKLIDTGIYPDPGFLKGALAA